jgi:catechol 2,3-dioxygenase-like lactoylglutathione lyase family enzyme
MRLHHINQALVATPSLEQSITFYRDGLGLFVSDSGAFPASDAKELGLMHLADHRQVWVSQSAHEAPWLRIVELTDAPTPSAFLHQGWLALEVLVDDVDAFNLALNRGQYEGVTILQGAKDLDFSDAIRAMQIQGPGGEVLYLTQVKRTVPPFRLPLSPPRSDEVPARVLGPFVAVMACKDAVLSRAFYQGLGSSTDTLANISFQTKLSALNHARGLDIDVQHPVETLQLVGDALIEFDQPNCAMHSALTSGPVSCGLLAVTFARLGLRGQSGPSRVMAGPDGELLVLR